MVHRLGAAPHGILALDAYSALVRGSCGGDYRTEGVTVSRGGPGPMKAARGDSFEVVVGGSRSQCTMVFGGAVVLHSRNIWKVMLDNGIVVPCTLGGKLRVNSVRVMQGDAVKVEMSPYDLTRGRIIHRPLPDYVRPKEENRRSKTMRKKKGKRAGRLRFRMDCGAGYAAARGRGKATSLPALPGAK